MEITKEGNLRVKALLENYDFSQFYPSATFSRSSVATKLDGTSVVTNAPRYEAGKFGNGIMVEEGTTNLVFNSDFEIMKTVKERVFFDDFNRTPTLTFARSSTNSNKTLILDFNGKVAGSLVENPHTAKYISGGASTFGSPTTFTTEHATGGYSNLMTQDTLTASISTSTNGRYAQQLFSFDILSALKRANLIPQSWDVATLKANFVSGAVTWIGYGVGSNAGVSTNGATVKVWDSSSNTWSGTLTNSASSPATISGTHTSIVRIDSNGLFHVLAHSTYASNGTIASTIYTDYVKLDVTVTSPDLARNPETGVVIEPNEVRYVQGRFHNLLSKNQSDVEIDLTGLSGVNSVVVAIDNSVAWQGSSSIKVSTNNLNTTQRAGVDQSNSAHRTKIIAGRTYIASAYIRASENGKTISPLMDWYNISNNRVVANWGSAISVNSTGWTRVSMTLVAPTDAVTVAIQFGPRSDQGTFDYWIDGMQLEEAVVGQTTPTEWRVGGSGKAVFVEEGTTNSFANPTFSSNASGWTNTGMTVDNSSSIAILTKTGAAFDGLDQRFTNLIGGATYTISHKVKYISGSQKFGSHIGPAQSGYKIRVDNGDWVNSNVITVSNDGLFHIVEIQFVALMTITDSRIWVQPGRSDAMPSSFYVEYSQLEQKAYRTSFVNGTRNTEVLTIPTTGLSPTAGTWEHWVYVNDNIRKPTGDSISRRVFEIKSTDYPYALGFNHHYNGTIWQAYATDTTGSVKTVVVQDADITNGWHLISVSWTLKLLTLYVDGVLKGTVSIPNGICAFDATSRIGNYTSSAGHSNTYHDAIRASSVERTAAEILAYYNATSPLSQLDDKTVFLLNFDGDLDAEATVQNGWNNVRNHGVSGFRIKGNKLYAGNNFGNYFWDSQLTNGDTEWTDVDISCKVKIDSTMTSVTVSLVGYLIRSNDSASNYLCVAISTYNGGRVYVQKRVSGTASNVSFVNTPIAIGTEYTLRTVITGTSGTVYLNGIQILTFAVPTDTPTQGRVGPYSSYAEATFDDIEVKADVPDKWASYTYQTTTGRGYACFTSSVTRNGSRVAKFTGNGGSDLGFAQSVTVSPQQVYTGSVWVKGTASVLYRDETNGVTYFNSGRVNYSEWTRVSYTTTTPVGCTQLRMYILTNSTSSLYMDSVQIEQKAYATSYHRNDSLTVSATRNSEKLTIPLNGINRLQGTWEQWVLIDPKIRQYSSSASRRVFEVGRLGSATGYALSFCHQAGSSGGWSLFTFRDTLQSTVTSISLAENAILNGWNLVSIAWTQSSIKLYINGVLMGTAVVDLTDFGLQSSIGYSLSNNIESWSNTVHGDIRISNITRSDEEIIAVYNSNKSFVSDQYTVANYRFNGNTLSHTDIPMVIKKVNGVETLYLRGSVVEE